MRSPVSGRHRGREFGIVVREIVGLRDRIDRRPDDRMVDRLGDRITHQVDGQVTAPQALNVFSPRSYWITQQRRVIAYGEFLIHLECLHCRTRLVQDGRKSNCC